MFTPREKYFPAFKEDSSKYVETSHEELLLQIKDIPIGRTNPKMDVEVI